MKNSCFLHYFYNKKIVKHLLNKGKEKTLSILCFPRGEMEDDFEETEQEGNGVTK